VSDELGINDASIPYMHRVILPNWSNLGGAMAYSSG